MVLFDQRVEVPYPHEELEVKKVVEHFMSDEHTEAPKFYICHTHSHGFADPAIRELNTPAYNGVARVLMDQLNGASTAGEPAGTASTNRATAAAVATGHGTGQAAGGSASASTTGTHVEHSPDADADDHSRGISIVFKNHGCDDARADAEKAKQGILRAAEGRMVRLFEPRNNDQTAMVYIQPFTGAELSGAETLHACKWLKSLLVVVLVDRDVSADSHGAYDEQSLRAAFKRSKREDIRVCVIKIRTDARSDVDKYNAASFYRAAWVLERWLDIDDPRKLGPNELPIRIEPFGGSDYLDEEHILRSDAIIEGVNGTDGSGDIRVVARHNAQFVVATRVLNGTRKDKRFDIGRAATDGYKNSKFLVVLLVRPEDAEPHNNLDHAGYIAGNTRVPVAVAQVYYRKVVGSDRSPGFVTMRDRNRPVFALLRAAIWTFHKRPVGAAPEASPLWKYAEPAARA